MAFLDLTPAEREEYKDLNVDVHDCEESLRNDQEALRNAKRDVEKSTVYWAEAIIKLDNFKKQHGL